MNNPLTELLKKNGVLLADGAVGTNLFAVGLQTGDAPELWNVDHPDRINNLHQSFIDAGSDIILTNTFGGVAAAKIAKQAANSANKTVLVAGSMGPTGEILAPNGPVSIEEAAASFKEQAEALKEGGADILWIETISSAEEIEAAVLGASDVGLPIVYTVSIDTNGRTMMGLTASDTVSMKDNLKSSVSAVGTNCGVGASEVVAAILNFRTATGSDDEQIALVAKANCGIPEYVDGKVVYNGTPELMAQYAGLSIDAGANIIGGCCGTTPEHVKAMRGAIDTHTKNTAPDLAQIESILGEVSVGAKAQLSGDLSVAGGSASGRGSRVSKRRRKSTSSD